ncbi:TetR/AcrR family transcriptional regulator [Microbacterium caowuchunii]|uniref:TetR/AcrR family transcriptional regulator n=1 Tax=Microbacterium caowuchunii TaxID=2614638 RepID=UPI0012475E4E|nr:TetR/AcrR family transcriptional regulator [Microbacterium caowuchunii]QEV99453.1 TetR/AcrR family transcriptional regulator [Microbacterium caowuchunii]
MPKITAPTVAEHRVAQRAALVQAAESVLRESGLAGINPRVVCERAGMARSSFYDYFPSKDDLLVAVAIEAFERWDREIEEALEGIETPEGRLEALVEATMRMTADGEHDIAAPLRQAELSPTRFEDLMVLHDALLRPMNQAITDLGVPDPDRAAMLANGLLGSGVQLVQHGVDPHTVARDVYRMLTRGLLA